MYIVLASRYICTGISIQHVSRWTAMSRSDFGLTGKVCGTCNNFIKRHIQFSTEHRSSLQRDLRLGTLGTCLRQSHPSTTRRQSVNPMRHPSGRSDDNEAFELARIQPFKLRCHAAVSAKVVVKVLNEATADQIVTAVNTIVW